MLMLKVSRTKPEAITDSGDHKSGEHLLHLSCHFPANEQVALSEKACLVRIRDLIPTTTLATL